MIGWRPRHPPGMAGFSLALGTGIGKQDHRGREKRQQTYRQQQAKGGRPPLRRRGRVPDEQGDPRRAADGPAAAARRLPAAGDAAGPVGVEARRRPDGSSELGRGQLAARERELEAREGQLERSGPAAREVAGARAGRAAVADPLVAASTPCSDRAARAPDTDDVRARLSEARRTAVRAAPARDRRQGQGRQVDPAERAARRGARAHRRRRVHEDRHLVPRGQHAAGDGATPSTGDRELPSVVAGGPARSRSTSGDLGAEDVDRIEVELADQQAPRADAPRHPRHRVDLRRHLRRGPTGCCPPRTAGCRWPTPCST